MTDKVLQNPPPGADLWAWSLVVYARPGFAPAAIALQDEAGVDVNLLLHALWAGLAQQVRLSPAVLLAARETTAPWQAGVVAPLRSVRRYLKGAAHPDPALAGALRRQVMADELEAERGEQALLAALTLPAPDGSLPLVAAAANLAACAALAGAARHPELVTVLALAAGVDAARAAAALAAAGTP